MSIPQPFFPMYNRTPKHHGYLNTLHQTLGTSFRTFWGRVEEFLEARELWIDHKKLIFFPFSSAVTCTNHLLGVELSSGPQIQEHVLALSGSGADPVNVTAR
ncbi:hypothetical protein Taro_045955 [Colocasia esculenta]|uniref:Uncharacterized protein n=1 Tax=Colocasia esculenta TaxID=4460 RepID=A0A843X3H5_COLES|nr:hypothetical protein [Colocasia esculenta]